MLIYNFTTDIDNISAQISQVLNADVSEDVSVAGNVTSLFLGNLQIGKKSLEIPVNLVAAATVNLGL